MKACIAACDYEEDLHNLKTDSPTCSHEDIPLIMSTTSLKVAGGESWFHLSISVYSERLFFISNKTIFFTRRQHQCWSVSYLTWYLFM